MRLKPLAQPNTLVCRQEIFTDSRRYDGLRGGAMTRVQRLPGFSAFASVGSIKLPRSPSNWNSSMSATLKL
jgi:hypothetical protein